MDFIAPAHAQIFGGGGGGGGLDMITQMAPLLLIFVVFYFLLIRPQQKKTKEHRTMVDNLRRGDRVVTNGGIIGTVAKVGGDREIMLEIAEGVRVRVVRGMIAEVMARTESAASEAKSEAKSEKKEETES